MTLLRRLPRPIVGALLLSALSTAGSGCAAHQDFAVFRAHLPRSILVLPPLNDSSDPGASLSYLSVVTRPIAPPEPTGAAALKDPMNILSRRSVMFEYDSDAIKDEFRPMLQAHSKYLVDNRDSKLLIQGNCDERGSREYNIALGQRRADALKRLMVLLGAPEAKIETVSLGEEKPRCTDSTEECWAQNRRGDLLHAGEF